MNDKDREKQTKDFDEAVVVTEEPPQAALTTVDSNPSQLIALAIQKDLDIDKLERLMVMKERWDAQQAQKAFYVALSKFQKLVPTLIKDKHVHYVTKSGAVIDYDHTSLGKIQPQIQDAAAECGLSHRWEFNDGPDLMEVTCILTHIEGHSERSSQSTPVDTSGNKSTIHGRQSSRTYLERSTVIGVYGLMSADKDDDGRQGQTGAPGPEETMKGMEPLPEGTETKAPKPETPGKTDFEKRQQLYGYLCEIIGINPNKVDPLTTKEKEKLSAELVELTRFDEKPEGISSLRDPNLKGKWLNTALGKAKGKLGHATARDELLRLLDYPGLDQEIVDGFLLEAGDGRHKESWFKDQIPIVEGLIADAGQEKQGALNMGDKNE